jgi:ubiquinone/menaquinone biosynthesis C-methylase UbiE
MPEGSQKILNARSLQTANRRLAALLRPGMRVLDIGCGTGAITRGMAAAVGPHGRVVGVDVNAGLIAAAQQAYGDVPNLSFEVHDAYCLPFREVFDMVSASRVLQWLSQPIDALYAMRDAAGPGGLVVVLDYNHERAVWQPELPPSMQQFYRSFLQWRAESGMDNTLADRLAELFEQVGLIDVIEHPQPECTTRSDPDFDVRTGLWADVAASRGHQMVQDGMITEQLRALAEVEHRAWVREAALSQDLYLLAVEGKRPTEPVS